MKLSDFGGLLKKTELKFISAENVSGDYWVVKLEPAKGMTWIPGEHGIFTIPGKKLTGKKWRAFSVASTPREGNILLGTRTGAITSNFKNALFSLKPGEKVNVRGPFGWFKLQKGEKQIVMFATGVGITPIRALAFELKEHPEVNAELIQTGKYHLFREEIEKLTEEVKNLK